MCAAKLVELSDKNTCEICRNVLGLYKCPKCDILYCSLSCYQDKAHLQCSEMFYKDSLYEQLKNDNGEEKAKEKMLEILKRTHETNKIENSKEENDELDSDDDSSSSSLDCEDLTERMKGVNLDDAEDVWQHLNTDEKHQFEKFLTSGDVSQYITKWQPWWTYTSSRKLLNIAHFEKQVKNCPEKFNGIKKYTDLTKKPPSDCLKHNLSNILASYLFICRYFNGEQTNAAVEAVTYLLTICLTLKENVNFDATDMAVTSVKMQCLLVNWILTDEENLDYMDSDLKQVTTGPHASQKNFYIICALSELHSVLTKALNAKNSDLNGSDFYKKFTDGQFPNIVTDSKILVKLARKKIEYFLAYVQDFL